MTDEIRERLEQASAKDVEALLEARGAGLPAEELQRRLVPLGSLAIAPEVFQPRDFQKQPWEKDRHVAVIAEAIADGKALDPILVLPVAGFRVVLDGHCRLRAYRQAGCGDDQLVPVDHFTGSVMAARLQALVENSKDKLALSKEEKLEAAWKLMKDRTGPGNPPYSVISEAAQVSKGTLTNMNNVLEDSDLHYDPRTKTWAEAKRGGTAEARYDENWQEAVARNWATRLRKAFGDKPNSQPEIFWTALGEAYPRLNDELEELKEAAYGPPDF